MTKPRWRFIANSLIAIGLGGLLLLLVPYVIAALVPIATPPPHVLPIPSESTKTSERLLPTIGAIVTAQSPVLQIAKLNLSVPIVANVDASKQFAYNMALKKGVAQLAGTATLDAATGNTFIIGHSSRFAPSGTPYDVVFADLSKLNAGDRVTIVTPQAEHDFAVTESRSVSPNDTSVLDATPDRVVTLMTCWPPGTTFKRWVVRAKPL